MKKKTFRPCMLGIVYPAFINYIISVGFVSSESSLFGGKSGQDVFKVGIYCVTTVLNCNNFPLMVLFIMGDILVIWS